jgi:hypothetical protein
MKKIGVLFGMENSFPGALVERINALNVDGITAEFVETGAVHLDKAPKYSVIVDRISTIFPSIAPISSMPRSTARRSSTIPFGGRRTTSFSTTR